MYSLGLLRYKAAKKIQSIARGNKTRKQVNADAPHYRFLNKLNTLPDDIKGKIMIMYKKSVFLEPLLEKYRGVKIYEGDGADNGGEWVDNGGDWVDRNRFVLENVLKSKKISIYDIEDELDFTLDVGRLGGYGKSYYNVNNGLKLLGEVLYHCDKMEEIELYSGYVYEIVWDYWFKGAPNLKKLTIQAMHDMNPEKLEGLDHLVITGKGDEPWSDSGGGDFYLGECGPYTKIKKVTIYTIMLPANHPRPATSFAREDINPYPGPGLYPLDTLLSPTLTGEVDVDYIFTDEDVKNLQARFPDSEIVYSEDGYGQVVGR
jgi:hypothetical protein